MNFDKRHNVFSDIPGIDASKGERIVKALQRLCEKIERLEQIRNFERNSKSKEELSSSIDEDPSISDVRYKLLILQLQYVRSILRKKGSEGPKTTSRETQTGGSLIGVHSPPSKDARVSEAEGPPPQNTTTRASEPKPHYHMKLDDVPFILGACSGASHSVVANVQTIIAKMKSHNKVLCGGPARTREKTNASETLMLTRELTKGLRQLSTKQEGLAKRMDAVEIGQKQTTDRRRKKVNVARCRSNSESSAVPTSNRKPFAPPASDRAGRSTTNPPIAARRLFLRSLQTCKSHLSEEDISWS